MPTRVSIEDKARAFDILSKKLNLSFDFDRLRLDVSSVELGFSGDGKITASYEFIDLKNDSPRTRYLFSRCLRGE